MMYGDVGMGPAKTSDSGPGLYAEKCVTSAQEEAKAKAKGWVHSPADVGQVKANAKATAKAADDSSDAATATPSRKRATKKK
jgi:hypothetical protein